MTDENEDDTTDNDSDIDNDNTCDEEIQADNNSLFLQFLNVTSKEELLQVTNLAEKPDPQENEKEIEVNENETDNSATSASSSTSTSTTSTSSSNTPSSAPKITTSLSIHFEDKTITDAVTKRLTEFISFLTIDVLKKYEDDLKLELAEAASAAMYKNNKRSQMSEETSKIINAEQSINAPIVTSIINEQVDSEVKKLQNKLATLEHRIKLKKEEERQVKYWASSEVQEAQAHYF